MLFSKMADRKLQRRRVQVLIQPLFLPEGLENQLLVLAAVLQVVTLLSSCFLATTERHPCENS